MENKGLEVMTGEDLMEQIEKMPEMPELEYKTTKNHFLIFVKNPKGKWIERYHISKIYCRTVYEQMDWVLHMERKMWIDGYKFIKEFSKAIEQWGYAS